MSPWKTTLIVCVVIMAIFIVVYNDEERTNHSWLIDYLDEQCSGGHIVWWLYDSLGFEAYNGYEIVVLQQVGVDAYRLKFTGKVNRITFSQDGPVDTRGRALSWDCYAAIPKEFMYPRQGILTVPKPGIFSRPKPTLSFID